MRFTSLDPLAVKILYMAKRIEKAPAPRVGGEPEPTEMGRRILGFMGAYRITNHADFAENVLGISRQRFHAWLYKKIDPENIAAQPILKCAEALGTNAEFLLCITDDPRAETSLTYQEHVLVQAFRDLSNDNDRERLLSIAAGWVAQATTTPSTSAPFPGAASRDHQDEMKLTALLPLVLTACAGLQPNDDALYARAHGYEGHPLTDLMAKLGAPDLEKQVGPGVWHTWTYSAVQGSEYGVYSLDCRFTAVVDPGKDQVVQVLVAGSKGGCRRFLGRL
jgi:hypothetical protein